MQCRICSSQNVDENAYVLPFRVAEGQDIETHVHRCRYCGVHYRDIDFESPEVGAHFEVAGYVRLEHEATFRKEREPFFRSILAEVTRDVGETTGKTLLDIGCAYGHMMDVFQDEGGMTASGVERNAELRKHLSEKGFPMYTRLSEIGDTRFDVIALIDSLYSFQDPQEALRQVQSLLKDGGLVVIRVTNRAWLANIYNALGKRVPYICMGDAKYSFTLKSIKYMLGQAGLRLNRKIAAEKGKRASRLKKEIFYKFTQIITQLGIATITPGLLLTCRKAK